MRRTATALRPVVRPAAGDGKPPAPMPADPGGWVRWSRYELRDGVLRAAPGARLEWYDPWASHRAARTGRGGTRGHAPYASLLQLVWSVRLLPGRPGEPPRLEPAGERALLAWCNANGLLGLLPHEAELACLAPRRAADPSAEGRVAALTAGYGYGYAGWSDLSETWRPPETPPGDQPVVHGHRLGDGAWTTRPLGAAWGPYFPDVPAGERASHAYPRPLSTAFWTAYGEPLERFLPAAALFSDVVRGLGTVPRHAGPADLERTFASLAVGARPMLAVGATGLTRAWRSKSLLGALATMAWLDLTGGGRVADCDECGRPYVTGAYQARYCSARCRNTAVKRAYRGRCAGGTSVATELLLRAGDLWLNDQSGKHGGWVVRVLRVTPLSVEFEVVRGPSRSLKSRHRKPRRAFVRDFKPRRVA